MGLQGLPKHMLQTYRVKVEDSERKGEWGGGGNELVGGERPSLSP